MEKFLKGIAEITRKTVKKEVFKLAMKELSKLSIELEINFKMDILKVLKAKARKGEIK